MSAGFHSLEITEVRREIDDAISLRFALPEALCDTFRFTPGQHLTLRTEIAGEDIRRNYSLCVAPHEQQLRVAIKQIAGGVFSTWANATLKPGDRIEVMPPHGSFTWAFDPARRATYAGFAGGSGITPILSLLKTALVAEPGSDFILLYGNRTSNSIMFLEEIAELKNRFMDRLQVYHFLEHEEEDVELFNGRLDADKIAEVLTSLVDPAVIDAAFICGPGPMMDAAEAALLAAGVAREQIHVERFGTPLPAAGPRKAVMDNSASSAEVHVIQYGKTRVLRVPFDGAALLDAGLAAGLDLPYACKGGVCCTCRARVLVGEVQMDRNYTLEAREIAAGFVLTCQSHPRAPKVVVSYDER